MRWSLILLSAWIFPTATFAQVTLRTGEHPTFSRVVVTLPPQTEWKLGRSDDGYTLQLADIESIATEGFFDRIPRTRITNIAVTDAGSQLQFDVACTCYADAFLWQPNKLVIDIRDGPVPDTAPFESPLLDPVRVETADTANQQEPQGPWQPAQDAFEQPLILEQTEPPSDASDLNAFEQTVLYNLSRATSQGLLTPATDDAFVIEKEQETPTILPETVELPPVELVVAPPSTPGILVTSSIDQGLAQSRSANTTQTGTNCWSGTYFDIATWGDDRAFAEQIAEKQSALTGEFDNVREKDLIALAQTYLYFGLGREAQQVLRMDGVMSPARLKLISLAQVMDDDPVSPPIPPLMASCNNAVSLWALLATPQTETTLLVDRNAVLQTFRGLPLFLQLHLGPRLSDRMLDIGDLEGAEQALLHVNPNPDRTVEGALAEIAVTQARDTDASPVAALTTIAKTDSRMTPEGLLQLLNVHLAQHEQVPSDLLVLSTAMRFEAKDAPIATDLAAAEIAAHILSNHFLDASDLLQETNSAIGPERAKNLMNDLASAAATRGTDEDMLLLLSADALSPDDPTSQNTVADRFLQMGFPDLALKYLGGSASNQAMSERRYLRAQAAIDLERWDDVDLNLAGLTTERAASLRKLASARQSGYGLSRDAENTDAWRQGDWQTLSTGPDPLLSAATTLVLEERSPEPANDTPLAAGEALLAETNNLRTVVDELLTRFEVADPEG